MRAYKEEFQANGPIKIQNEKAASPKIGKPKLAPPPFALEASPIQKKEKQKKDWLGQLDNPKWVEDGMEKLSKTQNKKLLENLALGLHQKLESDFWNLKLGVSDADVFKVLKKLELMAKYLHRRNFVFIINKLRESGHLHMLFSNLHGVHIRKHHALFVKLAAMLSPQELIRYGAFQAGPYLALGTLLGQGNQVMEALGLDETEPFEKEDYDEKVQYSQAQLSKLKLGLHELSEEFFRMKYFDLQEKLENKKHLRLAWELEEWGIMIDMALELLFAEEEFKNPLSNNFGVGLGGFGYKLMGILGGQMNPTVLVKEKGKGRNTNVNDLYDNKSNTLFTPEQKEENRKQKQDKRQARKKNKTATKKKLPVKSLIKNFVKAVIIDQAEIVHQFFYEAIPDLIEKYPEFIPTVNEMMEHQLRPQIYRMVNKISNFKDVVKLNEKTNHKDLDKKTHSLLGGNTMKDNLHWADLARMWFFELGDPVLGQKGNELRFGENAKTTQKIRSHPSTANLTGYALSRIKAGDYSPFQAVVHYDVAGFWRAIIKRDVAFNFLGSFTVIISPSEDKSSLRFQVFNTSSLSSATRFRRDNRKRGRFNKIGIFSDREREEKEIGTEKTKKEPNIGGNIRCIWEWDQKIE